MDKDKLCECGHTWEEHKEFLCDLACCVKGCGCSKFHRVVDSDAEYERKRDIEAENG